jgi:hypothetical protein
VDSFLFGMGKVEGQKRSRIPATADTAHPNKVLPPDLAATCGA